MNDDGNDPSEARSRLKKALPASIVGLGLAATAILVGPSIATAQEEEAPSNGVTVEETEDADEDRAKPSLDDVLAPLVADGTLTQEQADAVAETLREQVGERRMGHHGGHGRGDVTVLTDLLGITEEELGEQLRSGMSLAEVAEANGVDTQSVIDALVAEKQANLDQAVADGRISAEEAAERAANIEEHVTDHVNGEFNGPRGRGFGAPPGDANQLGDA